VVGYGLAAANGMGRNLRPAFFRSERDANEERQRTEEESKSLICCFGDRISEDNVNSSSTAKTVLFWDLDRLPGRDALEAGVRQRAQAREDTPTYSVWMQKVDAGDVKEVTMYLSPNSYDLQGEYYKPANMKFQVTIPKEKRRR